MEFHQNLKRFKSISAKFNRNFFLPKQLVDFMFSTFLNLFFSDFLKPLNLFPDYSETDES